VDRVVNVVEEGIDIAVRIGHLQDSSLVAIEVGAVRRVVCASPPYLKRHGAPKKPAQITTHACIQHTGLAPHGVWNSESGDFMWLSP
jgi:DNA-binding transcriptional LysR family regulator